MNHHENPHKHAHTHPHMNWSKYLPREIADERSLGQGSLTCSVVERPPDNIPLRDDNLKGGGGMKTPITKRSM